MHESVLALRRQWSTLAEIDLEDLAGDLRAVFVPPLRHVAPAGLGLIGLRRWFGKRFRTVDGTVVAVNLVRRSDRLVEVMPMSVGVAPSLADGASTVVITYPPRGRRPWRWVRDELRRAGDGTIVGMTFVDLPVLRRFGGLPFRLVPPAS